MRDQIDIAADKFRDALQGNPTPQIRRFLDEYIGGDVHEDFREIIREPLLAALVYTDWWHRRTQAGGSTTDPDFVPNGLAVRPAPETAGLPIFGAHPVLRHRLREQLAADPDGKQRLVLAIEELAEQRAASSDAAVTDRHVRAELDPLIGLLNELGDDMRPESHVHVANFLTTSLADLARLRDGKTILVRAIAIVEQHFDQSHPTLATSYSNLATILKDLGGRKNLDRAIALLRSAYEIFTRHADPRAQIVAKMLRDLLGEEP